MIDYYYSRIKFELSGFGNIYSLLMQGVGYVRIDGSVPSAKRNTRVKKFAADKKVRAFTLTSCGFRGALVDSCPARAQLVQAEDRSHRIGMC